MEFEYAYQGSSHIASEAGQTAMHFSPDTLREPTFFRGDLAKGVAFREAISALHDVVVSDLRWKPKDRTAYLRWRATQEEADLAEIAARRKETAGRLRELRAELKTLDDRSFQR